MNNKAVTLSVMMAILAVFFVQSYVGSVEEEQKKKFGTEVLVIKAKGDIKEQETVNDTMIEIDLVPKRFIEPSAIFFEKTKMSDDEKAKYLRQMSGSVAVVPIRKGEQITQTKLIVPGIRTGLAPQVTPGKRAVSVPISEVTGVGKLVKPGDRVDVIVVMDPGTGKENKIVKTVLQDIVVLAVGKNVTNNIARTIETDMSGKVEKIKPLTEDTNFGTVTLEVKPEQAQMVALIAAGSENAIMLSLRNNDDMEMKDYGTVMMTDLLGPDAARITRNPAGKR